MSEEKHKEIEKKPEIVVKSTEETKKGGGELEKVDSKTDSSIKHSS
jgi:hypothetical protein